jgi:hypothetical protein
VVRGVKTSGAAGGRGGSSENTGAKEEEVEADTGEIVCRAEDGGIVLGVGGRWWRRRVEFGEGSLAERLAAPPYPPIGYRFSAPSLGGTEKNRRGTSVRGVSNDACRLESDC